MKIPITQSKSWQALQTALGEETVFEKTENYQFLAIIKRTKAGNYLFLPYGPLAADATAFKKALSALKSLAIKHRAIFIRIEPMARDFAKLLPPSATKVHDVDPADTWTLDLTGEREAIISNFSQGTRTRFHNYAKKGITVAKSTAPEDIRHLTALQNKLYKTKHLTAFTENYLKTELAQPFANLYLVKYNREIDATRAKAPDAIYPEDGQILAASLFFDFGGTRYYMQSAADQDFKRLPATVALLTTAIFDAKDQGIKTFDFWGIAPDGAPASHPWAGFTEFKKSFGGTPCHYAGTYDIVLDPFRYRLFIALQKLIKALKH